MVEKTKTLWLIKQWGGRRWWGSSTPSPATLLLPSLTLSPLLSSTLPNGPLGEEDDASGAQEPFVTFFFQLASWEQQLVVSRKQEVGSSLADIEAAQSLMHLLSYYVQPQILECLQLYRVGSFVL